MTTIESIISTPGEILKEEFLDPLGISQYQLAKTIGKPQSSISDIIHNRRSITPEMAYLIGSALGTTAEFWLRLQATYQAKSLALRTDLPAIRPLVDGSRETATPVAHAS
ncbi:MAG: HigA family addiction module antitoxin [Slackia sp.]|nr:HigA family addiction module antitoxin [Slackia sp.]